MLVPDWSSLPSAHILILEDDPSMREVLAELLEDEGHTVEVASRGEEALDRASKSHFDLLIFDIRMEGIDGLETLAGLLARGLTFPSLAITGYAGEDDPLRAIRLGVGAYLKKPFRPEQLLEAVNRLLTAHFQRREDQQRLQSLRDAAWWVARALSPALPGGLLPERTLALARAAGLPEASARELELVSLALNHPELPEAPPSLQRWLAALDERYDARGHDIPLEARLLALARAAVAAEQQGHADVVGWLSGADSGRFDPILLEALAKVYQPPPSAPGRRRLGLALASADPARALASLVATAPGTPEAVEACLAIAQLHPNTLLPQVQRAVEQARSVGPLALANAYYRGGLLLRRAGAPEAEAALRHAGPRLAALGLSVQAGLAELALGVVRPETAELLLRPESEAELAGEADWVLPLLWPLGERVQRRLANRFPQRTLDVRSFGALSVTWGSRPLDESAWRGPFVKYLFAFLAAQERPVQEDRILSEFWPEHHENSKRRLSCALSAVRRAIRDVDPVVRARDRYSLNPEMKLRHDVLEFAQARLAAERAGSPEEACRHWSRMASLQTAPYLEGCYMDWALQERQRLEDQLVEALLSLASTCLEREPERGLEALQRALSLDALQQRAHLLAIKALVRLGQPEKAVRQFNVCQETLHRELGLEPSTELLEAYHRARLACP